MSRFVVPPTLLLAPLLWLFRRALFSGEMFIYRDAAHYYFPLYHYVQSRWASGGLPLWNPLDGIGQPLLGDPTAAVLYPGKLIFVLPFDFATCFALYVVGHLWLAGWGTYVLARCWRVHWQGALLGGLAYELSGQVLFQYCNPIYCIGAAGLPWAVLFLDRTLVTGDRRAAVGLGVVLSLMTLGGDPQTAYHVLLMGLLLTLLLAQRERKHAAIARAEKNTPSALAHGNPTRKRGPMSVVPSSPVAEVVRLSGLTQTPELSRTNPRSVPRLRPRSASRQTGKYCIRFFALFCLANASGYCDMFRRTSPRARTLGARGRLALLLVACLVALMLSAVQVLPSLQWSRQSDRVLHEEPRTICEWVADTSVALWQGRSLPPVAGLWERSSGDGHAAKVNDFSVGPWRWVELLWPNVSGQQFPIHRRWVNGIPAEGRVWTPSLYMGLVPLMLVICRARFLRGTVRLRWLSWLAVISIIAALGTYGLAWLVEEIRFHVQGAAFQPSKISPGCGGLYWLMTVTLPSYMVFRYPAKLWTISVLVMSLLAAKGWSSHIVGRSRLVLSRRLCWFALISLLLGALTAGGWKAFVQLTSAVPSDSIFGPFDAALSWGDVVGALIHGAAVTGLAAWSIRASRTTRRAPRWVGLLVLLMSAIELTVAQSWMIQTAPITPWQLEQSMETVSHPDLRLYRGGAWRGRPPHWKTTSSWDRQTIGLRWDYRTMLPKYHLLLGNASLASAAPFSSADYHVVLEVAAGYGTKGVEGAQFPHRSVLNLLGANYLFVPPEDYAVTGLQPDDMLPKSIASAVHVPTQTATWYRNTSAFPRAWIVHNWKQWGVIPLWTSKALRQRTEAVLFPYGKPRDFTATAIVEGGPADSAQLAHGQQSTAEICRVVRDTADSIELTVKLDRAGIVVLGDQYFSGWRVYVAAKNSDDYQRRDVLCVNRVMRGVLLERGEYSIKFSYEPVLLRIGLALSALTWLLLAAWVVLRCGRQAAYRIANVSGRRARRC